MMLFKRHALLIVAFLMFSTSAFSDKVDAEKARKVATNWYQHYAPASKQQASITKVKEYKWGDRTSFYICSFDQGGFVIVSANDQVTPILGYGFEHGVPDEITNEAVKGWFDGYARQIDTAFVLNLRSDEESAKWNEILTNKFPKLRSDTVGPLLTTAWDQGCYYNEMCPADPDGSCGHTLVGCTATAMAQIMKYWDYPEGGVGYYSYLPRYNPQYGQQSVFFNESDYNWANMPDSLTSQNSSVATLMYHCGVAARMSYNISGSAAGFSDASQGLKTYFDYSDSLEFLKKDSFSFQEWKSMLKNELDESRPILYEGYGTYLFSPLGHAWVCDGYSQMDYFHMNWGWSGIYDGYFLLDSLNPFYSFNDDQGAIFGIEPKYSSLMADFEPMMDSILQYQFIDYSKGNPTSFQWDFGDGTTTNLQNPLHVFDTAGIYSIRLIVDKNNSVDTVIKNLNVQANIFFLEEELLEVDGSAGIFDYDGDNQLDLFLSGWPAGSFFYKYDTGAYNYVPTNIPYGNINYSIDFVDTDNNNTVDMIFSSIDFDEPPQLYVNDTGQYVHVDNFTNNDKVAHSMCSGDFNNDGKVDLYAGGTSIIDDYVSHDIRILKNRGNNKYGYSFDIPYESPSYFYNNYQGISGFCDLDRDGDQDFIIDGHGYEYDSSTYGYTIPYQGLNIFENINDSLIHRCLIYTTSRGRSVNGLIECWDYNSDGLPDIAYTGGGLYKNNGNFSFTKVSDSIMDHSDTGNISFGDANNDGSLDIIIGSKLFVNAGNDSFVLAEELNSGVRSVFGDIDKDGDLDILSWRHLFCGVYENLTEIHNESPTIPDSLNTLEISQGSVKLEWAKSYDDHTPRNGLSYNICIGQTDSTCEIVSPLSDLQTGFRKIARKGNVEYKNFYIIKGLTTGKYYWRVQAIDNSFIGSEFSTIDSFYVAQCNLPPEMDRMYQVVTLNKPQALRMDILLRGYFDPEGDSLASIRVEGLPTSGLLSLNGIPVTVNQVVSKNQLANLQYVNHSHQQGDYIIIRPNDGYNWAVKSNKMEFEVQLFEAMEFSSLNLHSEYKWGDYNNDGILDLASSAGVLKNQNNDFQIIDSIFLETSTINWADIDNDNDLDLLFQEHVIINEGNDIFNETSTLTLDYLDNSSTKGTFGDVNNDNQPDYLLSGSHNGFIPFSKVFINNGFGSFPDSLIINLLGFRHGAIAIGDYDSDGDQDIAICGIYSGNERKTIIYSNKDGQFIDIEANLSGVNVGTLDWGDFDKDGDLDLLLCGSVGTAYNAKTEIYQNNNGTFELFINNPSWVNMDGVFLGFAKWADIDCDGYLDVLFGGCFSYSVQFVKFYKNNAGEGFSLISKTGLPPLNTVSCNLADYNNDGYIDMVLSGKNEDNEIETAIYRNGYGTNSNVSNNPPNAPENLRVSVSDDEISFSWDKSNDDSTPQEAISYNIYVYSILDSSYIVSPLADTSSGFRKIAGIGNTSLNNSFTLDSLPLGTYYWSVQSIDNSFAGGPFAPVDTFTVASIINQEVNLSAGWNIASWNVIPENMNIQEILQPIIDDAKLLKGVDENGNILQQMPWGWVNSIGNMANTEGYQIKITEPCTLSTTGLIVALPMDIPFISGWNLMGWPAQSAEDAQTAFTSLINTNHLVKVIDQSGNILQQLPWGWVNNIGSLSPGQGYQVKVSSNCAITINQPVGDNILAPIKMPPTRFLRSQQKGNPYNPMTFALRNNDNLPQNTEIGVYYKDQCFGAAVLTGEYIYITAGMDEVDTEEKEGFGTGEAFHFKFITEGMQEAQELEVAYIEGDKSFLERGTFVGEIKSVLAADDLQATASWIGEAHPNPTRDEVFVDLSLAEPTTLYLSLMDSHGKIVLEERTEKPEGAQRQRINLSEFSPGVYFLKIQIENESAYQEKVLRIVRM